jgi:peptidoglycan/LPS O-acetylase OafA/YrhL
MLYHADLPWIIGGFLGVEIFFVISGYLITAILLHEWQSTNQINLGRFWLRRARRLLPALFALLLATVVFAVVFLPDEVANLRRQTLAALGYFTNWHLIWTQVSYFDTIGRPSLLLHLWSLAIEEQFYLIWPMLVLFGLKHWSRRTLALITCGGALTSTLIMFALYRPEIDPSRLYYGTDTRASGLLIGAALAFCWSPQQLFARRWVGWLIDLLGLVGLLVAGWFVVTVGNHRPELYQGGFLVLGLATAAIIAAAVHPYAPLLPRLLALPPLVWLGVRSYSLYLWHWPIFMVTRPMIDVPLEGWPLLVLRLGLTFLVAELSYRLIETPIRQGALGRAWHNWRMAHGQRRRRLSMLWFSGSGAFVASIAALSVVVVEARPPAPPDELLIGRVQTGQLATAQIPALPSATPGPVATPTLDVAALEMAQSQDRVPTAPLPTPTPEPPPRIIAIGDSVMVGAASELQRAIPNVEIDAAVNRQISAGIALLRNLREHNQLPTTVIVHLGTNGTFDHEHFTQLMEVLHDVPRVIIVNVRAPRRWEPLNNTAIHEGASQHTNVIIVDWHSFSKEKPEFFRSDGVHLVPEGQRAYADLIAISVYNQ